MPRILEHALEIGGQAMTDKSMAAVLIVLLLMIVCILIEGAP